MAYGETYVEVDASVVNGGIAPMAIVSNASGPEEGETDLVVWIRWYYDDGTGEGGFTGQGWFWNDKNNILPMKFGSEQEFKDYLIREKPTDLEDYLATGTAWPIEMKRGFYNSHFGDLGPAGCFSV